MKKAIKSFVCIVISFMMITALAACGTTNAGNQESNVDNSQQNNSETKANHENSITPTGNDSIVIYFSRTNNTERIAEFIIEETSSASYEILAKVPYSNEDINYNNSNSRANKEQNDPTARPEIGSDMINLTEYEVIYLGYPIWWGQAPKIMYTFVESYDLSGKTIVPFCTSASSGIGADCAKLADRKKIFFKLIAK